MPPSVSWWRFFRFQSVSKRFSMDFRGKVVILREFWKWRFAQNCHFRAFNASSDHKIIFVKCCLDHQLSNEVLGVIIRRLKSFWRTQTSIGSRFLMFFINFHQKWHVWYQKMLSRNCNVWFWNARKIFCSPPDVFNGLGRVVWDLGYLQNQTGWSYDASINFYATKRQLVAIFSFSKRLKAIFNGF